MKQLKTSFAELFSEQLTDEDAAIFKAQVEENEVRGFVEYFNSPRGKALIRLFIKDFRDFIT